MTEHAPEEKAVPRNDCFLHIGSGAKVHDGWVNIDINEHPGVDVVADVTEGLDFTDVRAVFAEHFIEHLAINKALAFLLETYRVLARDGWLRLSTPNLEYVWATHYNFEAPAETKQLMTLGANRAFRGWGHQFLWSPAILTEALLCCGFRELSWCRYGESEKSFFRNLEKHDINLELPDVIIVEAQKGDPQPERLDAFRAFVQEHFLDHLDW